MKRIACALGKVELVLGAVLALFGAVCYVAYLHPSPPVPGRTEDGAIWLLIGGIDMLILGIGLLAAGAMLLRAPRLRWAGQGLALLSATAVYFHPLLAVQW
jgi:hypothetical protein